MANDPFAEAWDHGFFGPHRGVGSGQNGGSIRIRMADAGDAGCWQ